MMRAMTRGPPRQVLIPPRVCRQCLSTRLQAIHPSVRRQSSSTTPPRNSTSPDTSLSQRTAEYIDTLQLRALAASQRLNDITGYSSIESLKAQIRTQESKAQAAREAVVNAKRAYSTAVTTRAETQRELTNLLNRKTSWNPDDLARFTTLYPSDHENENRVQRTAEELSRAERDSEEASAELGRLILSRYHEEQIWSDKIRRASTWGTFALMGINVLLFVVVQIGLEPWRRKRLVRGFEEKVKEAVMQIPQQSQTASQTMAPQQSLERPSIEQLPIQRDTNSITNQESKENGDEEGIEDVTVLEAEVLPMEEIEKIRYIPEKKDIWISAAGGAIVGGLITALGTWLISR